MRITNATLISFFLLWCFSWLMVGAYYCFPNAEDLSLSLVPRDSGILYSVIGLLISYDGRYFTNLLHAINPLVFDWLAGYKLMPVIGMLFFVSALWFFTITLFRSPSKLKLLTFALLFSAVHFALTPSIPHDLYWMVSSFVYLYPWSVTFLWVGAYLRYIHSVETRYLIIWFLITVISLICCVGMNEMFLATNGLLLIFISYSSWRMGKSIFIKTLPVVLVGIACMLFFISCPGISLRMAANMPAGGSLWNVKGMVQSLVDYKFTTFNFSGNGILICGSLLVLLHFHETQFRYTAVGTIVRKKNILSIMVGFFVGAYLMTLAYYLPMQADSGYPSRIFNSVVILQQLVFFVVVPLFFFGNGFILRVASSVSMQNTLTLLLIALLIIFTFKGENNISNIYYEYKSGIFEKYEKTMHQRYAAMETARQTNSCWRVAVLDSLENPPRTNFYGPDLVSNRGVDYWNAAYEMYFRVDEVRLQRDTAKKEVFLNL